MRKVSSCNQHTMKDGRYIPISTLGTGTYGQVVRCIDNATGAHVAIKIAHKEPAYRRSALNELRVLGFLSDVPEVVHISDSFEDEGRVCIVCEILNKNMYEALKDRCFEQLPLSKVASVGRVVLAALSALHAQGYMHCDIKPENVMLRAAEDDFANSCVIDFGAVRQFRENAYFDIQSLWYRAPEVICGLPYTPLIDSWSVGALLYELHTGSPLFPGDTPQEQLSSVIEMLGLPSEDAMTVGKNSPNLIFAVDSEGPTSPFHKAVSHEDPTLQDSFCDLLAGLLCPNEKRRLSCSEALRHPFFRAAALIRSSPAGTIVIDGMYDRADEDGLTSEDRQNSEVSGIGAFADHNASSIGSICSPMITPVKSQLQQGSATDLPSPPLVRSSTEIQVPLQYRPLLDENASSSTSVVLTNPWPPVQHWLQAVSQPPVPIGE